MLPPTPRGRLRWALTEASIVLGILLFWVVAVFAIGILVALLTAPIRLFGFDPVFFTGVPGTLSGAVVPMALVTAALYALVRAGVLLVDHWHGVRQ